MARPKARVVGADVLARNIITFTNRFFDEVNDDMEKVRELLDERVTENISLKDHSLEDLADLGHPYSRRNPQAIHSPEFQVHTQSGGLVEHKFSDTIEAGVAGSQLVASAFVGIDPALDYAGHVIFGTSKMIPRDFLSGSMEQVEGEALRILKRSLRDVVVSFRGKRVRL